MKQGFYCINPKIYCDQCFLSAQNSLIHNKGDEMEKQTLKRLRGIDGCSSVGERGPEWWMEKKKK